MGLAKIKLIKFPRFPIEFYSNETNIGVDIVAESFRPDSSPETTLLQGREVAKMSGITLLLVVSIITT
jgi:hypothetical protein